MTQCQMKPVLPACLTVCRAVFIKYKSDALLQRYLQRKLCAICASSLMSYFHFNSVCCLCPHKVSHFSHFALKHWHFVMNFTEFLPTMKNNVNPPRVIFDFQGSGRGIQKSQFETLIYQLIIFRCFSDWTRSRIQRESDYTQWKEANRRGLGNTNWGQDRSARAGNVSHWAVRLHASDAQRRE